MEMAQIAADVISQIGFPIAMCGALFWYMVKQREMHKSETDKLSDAVNNNNIAINNNTEILKMIYDKEVERKNV